MGGQRWRIQMELRPTSLFIICDESAPSDHSIFSKSSWSSAQRITSATVALYQRFCELLKHSTFEPSRHSLRGQYEPRIGRRHSEDGASHLSLSSWGVVPYSNLRQ